MSHAVNDEILERLYDEVVTEWGEARCLYTESVEAEVMRRFEDMGM